MKDQLSPEPIDRAQSKVDAQRDKIAKMASDDPRRADEERILDVLIKNAQLATTAHILLDDTDAPPRGV